MFPTNIDDYVAWLETEYNCPGHWLKNPWDFENNEEDALENCCDCD